MKGVWSEHDYELMRRRPLPFDPDDVKLIHKGVDSRLSHTTKETFKNLFLVERHRVVALQTPQRVRYRTF
jgi:hypothetical protein